MNAAAQGPQHASPPERQQLLLRALVGSLVLCAALGPTTAQSVVLAAQGPGIVQRETVVLRFHRALTQHAPDYKLTHAGWHSAARAQVLTPPHNMLASASGKQRSVRLEMSRAGRQSSTPTAFHSLKHTHRTSAALRKKRLACSISTAHIQSKLLAISY
jgi:hypothetical protein